MTRNDWQVKVAEAEDRISLARARRAPVFQIRDLCDKLDELLDSEPEETDE